MKAVYLPGTSVSSDGNDYQLFLSSRLSRKDATVSMEITDKQREILEYYLISNPDVLYTGNTKVYNYKPDKDEIEYDEGEENE